MATVHTIAHEGEFRRLMQAAVRKADVREQANSLLDILEMNGLTRNMVRRAVAALRTHVEYSDFANNVAFWNRIFSVCLRLMGLNSALHFCERTVADISRCLWSRLNGADYGPVFEELLDNEHALPFIFDAVKSTRDAENQRDVAWLAHEVFWGFHDTLRVTLVVRYHPQLPEIFLGCLGHDGDEIEAVIKKEYAGVLATSPSLLAKLLADVNAYDPDEPDPDELIAITAYDMCEVLVRLLANLLTEPSLIQHVLGCGVLTAVVSFYARYTLARRHYYDRDTSTARTIRQVLADYPVWTRELKRIAYASTQDNAVVDVCKSLPPRRPAGGILYVFCEEQTD